MESFKDPERFCDTQMKELQKALNTEMAKAVQVVVPDGGGLRYNEGKAPMELLPPEMFWAVAEVLKHGAQKYARRNWERGMAWASVYACAMRHLVKWFQGEDKDAESGLPHLWHAMTNLVFLVTYEQRAIGADDRPKVVKEATP